MVSSKKEGKGTIIVPNASQTPPPKGKRKERNKEKGKKIKYKSAMDASGLSPKYPKQCKQLLMEELGTLS